MRAITHVQVMLSFYGVVYSYGEIIYVVYIVFCVGISLFLAIGY
jgi:hypothetical protein